MRATKRRSDEATKGAAHGLFFVRPAFTLTELLIVIGIIVLMLALAVPAFNVIRGNRSVEAAENQLSALIARARTEAIGNQKITGVFFFRDPHNPDVVTAAEVWEGDISSKSRADGSADRQVYLDLMPERDFLALTPGVGLQVVDDCVVDTTKTPPRQDDGYIGYNTKVSTGVGAAPDTRAAYGGVILFDSYGRLTCQTYGFHVRLRTAAGTFGATTPMGDLLYYDPSSPSGFSTLVPNNAEVVDPGVSGLAPEAELRSQFGIVLFDAVAFKTAGGNDTDPQLLGTAYVNSGEQTLEEPWLDRNGTPLLVDRFNGTLNTIGQ